MEVKTSPYHATKQEIHEEEQLIRAAVRDMSKFSVLYDRYYNRIFRFVYQRVDSEDTAADITSQVFLKAMSHLKKYEFRGLPFASWLYRIAANELNQMFRKKKKERSYYAKTDDLKDIAEEMEEETPVERDTGKLATALNQLDDEDLELIEMKYFEKRQYKEIAEITGLSESNAKVKVFRILKKVRTIMTNQ